MTEIYDFLTQKINATLISGFTPGYERTNLDMLLQQARRTKTINGNYMLDFLQLENDPNYSKKNPVNQARLEKFISSLAGTTTVMTSFTSMITLLGVNEFVPANLKALLYNFTSLSNTGLNFLSGLQEDTFFKQVGINLLNDLMQNFQLGNISFAQLNAMALNMFNAMPQLSDIKNNGIRPLLSLPLTSLLPRDMLAIYSDLNYLDTLYGIFGDTAKATLFNNDVKARVKTYSATKVNAIPLSRDYADLKITLSDPLGINAADNFETDVRTSYTNNIETIVNEVAVNYPELSEEDIETIVAELQTDAEENVEEAFVGNLGLPSVAVVIQGVNTETYNKTVNVINTTFEKLTAQIIKDLGVNSTPKGEKSFDYLINVKKNLDARKKMKQVGAPSDDFVDIDNFLKTVVVNGDISETILDQLQSRLATLLKEDK